LNNMRYKDSLWRVLVELCRSSFSRDTKVISVEGRGREGCSDVAGGLGAFDWVDTFFAFDGSTWIYQVNPHRHKNKLVPLLISKWRRTSMDIPCEYFSRASLNFPCLNNVFPWSFNLTPLSASIL
jgi:hypothetical protein